MSAPLKIDQVLRDDDRRAFETLVAHPGTTRKAAWRWLREQGYDVSENAVRSYLRRARPKAKPKKSPLKVDRLLRPEDREEYKAMLADRGKSTKDLHQHLKGRGVDVSYNAVWRHREHWQPIVDEVRSCADFGKSLAEVAGDTPQAAMNEGSLLGLDQLILQQVFRLRKEEKVSSAELAGWVDTLSRTLNFRKDVLAFIRREQRRATEGPARRRGEREPFNGIEIANCVRRILGVPVDDVPMPQFAAPANPPAPSLPLPPGEPSEIGELPRAGRGEGT